MGQVCPIPANVELADKLVHKQDRQYKLNPFWVYSKQKTHRNTIIAQYVLSPTFSPSNFVGVGHGTYPSLLKAIKTTMNDERKTQEGFLRFLEKNPITQEMMEVAPAMFPLLEGALAEGEFFRESCAHFAIRSHPNVVAIQFLMDYIPLKEMEFSFLRRVSTLQDIYPSLNKNRQEEILRMVQSSDFQHVLQEEHHHSSKCFWQALIERDMIEKGLGDNHPKSVGQRKKM